MKNQLLFLLLFISTFSSAQIIQDWDLSPLGQRTYFERDNGFLEMYYNDSTEVFADYRKHFFGEKYYKKDFENCYDELASNLNMVGENLLADFPIEEWFSNDDFFYFLNGLDTIKFFHQAGLNFVWNFPTQNTSANYSHLEFECIDIIEKEIFGTIDSVRVYEINTLQNGSIVLTNLTGTIFELSKKFGWIKHIPLVKLVNPNVTFNEETFNLSGWEKDGINQGINPIFNLFYQEHQVGDIYKRKKENRNADWVIPSYRETTWTRDSVTNVNFIPDSIVEITYDRTTLNIYDYPNEKDTSLTTTTDHVIKYWKNTSFDLPYNAFPNYYYFPDQSNSGFLYKSKNLAIDDLGNFTVETNFSLLTASNCYFDFIIDNTSERHYQSNVGLTFLTNWSFENIYEDSLIGFKQGNIIEGDIDILMRPTSTSNNTLTNEKPSVQIYPNPTPDYLNFIFSKNQTEPFSIYIYDALGKLVLEKNDIKDESLDVSKLDKGFYFVKTSSSFGSFLHKIVKE